MYLPESDAIGGRTAESDASWQLWLRRCVGMLLLLMSAYVGIVWWGMRGDVGTAIKAFPISICQSVIGLVLVGIALRIVRWHYYVRCLGWPVSASRSVLAFLASLAFTATPGKAGEAIKSVLLRMHYDVPISAGVGVLIVERLGDLLAVLLLALGGVAQLTGANNYMVFAAIAIAVTTAFFSNQRIHGPLLERLARVKRLGRFVGQLARSLDASRKLLRPLPFLIGIGIALISWSCEGLAFYYLMRSAGFAFSPMQDMSIYGIATLVGALSALPGGLGGFEVVMVILLNHLGMSVAAATLPVAFFRLCTLWFGILVGVLFMLIWMLFIGSPTRRAPPAPNKA